MILANKIFWCGVTYYILYILTNKGRFHSVADVEKEFVYSHMIYKFMFSLFKEKK